MDVSIIIVNYNTKELLHDCLVSIYKQTKEIDFEIIVSDNASIDGSIEMVRDEFPKVILIENKSNLGFGAANNKGINVAKGTYIFYLNSDTILLNNAVKIFYDFWEDYPNNERLGAIGCNLVDENSNITESYGKFPTGYSEIKNLIFLIIRCIIISLFCIIYIDYKRIFKKQKVVKKIGHVDYISGAAFFLKKNRHAYFDELFFLYYEETDLQFNLNKNSKIRLLIDGPIICHLYQKTDVSHGIFKQLGGMSIIYASISRIKYLKKHKVSNFCIVIIKLLTIMLWINPFLLNKTKKYFSSMV